MQLHPRWEIQSTWAWSWRNVNMENTEITFCSGISCIIQSIRSKLGKLVFSLWVYLRIIDLLLGRICRRGLRNIRKVGLPILNCKYHDELWGEFGLWIYLTIEIVILLDPVHRTDGNSDALISFWVVIVWYDDSIS